MISSVLAGVNILKSSAIFRRQPEWLGLLVEAATHMLMFCVVCRIAPNCVIKAKSVRTRVFVSDEIEDCKDLSGLYYLLAFQKVKYYQHHFIFGQYFGSFLCRFDYILSVSELFLCAISVYHFSILDCFHDRVIW